ncbi:MAG: TraR/DksA family transcriptional regulator [Planctomycetales bacterium]|nr:TraR/DksA family transcriptional regulator [Planctomycetales bacterium]
MTLQRAEALAKLRVDLKTRREAMQAALQGDLTALNAIYRNSSDPVDFASESANEEFVSYMADFESRELNLIDEALLRLNSGEYGNCDKCESPIPLERLEAIPHATLCIRCQVEFEKSGFRD